MEGIHVTANGHVHCGGNQWFSLEQIQQAVLEKQNPGLQDLDPKPRLLLQTTNNSMRKQTTTNKQEALPLPSTLVRNAQPKAGCSCQKHTANEYDSGEHLPLPSTRQAIRERREQNLNCNDGEHLPLPTTHRKK